jgi:hypothetical protein
VESTHDQHGSLNTRVGAIDLHSQVTSHNHKRFFGTSFSSVSESEVPESEVLEQRTVHAAAEAGQE